MVAERMVAINAECRRAGLKDDQTHASGMNLESRPN
jgi:hypothetical protein